MRAIFLLALTSLPLQAGAADYWEYKDWRVWSEQIDTGEDLRRTCAASTGGDGDPVLRLEVSDGDVGPPDFYPYPVISETAPRHYTTQMQDGQVIQFRVDTGTIFSGAAFVTLTNEGLAYAEAAINLPNNRPVLKAMKKGSSMVIEAGGRTIFHASLAGFTAAYGKMMDVCGFSLSLD